MKMLLPLLVVSTACGVLSACGGPPSRASERDPKSVAVVDSATLVVLDDEARWGIELVDHRAQVLPDGRLKAQVRFVNRSPNDRHIQISWTFKDDKNFAVEPSTPFAHYLLGAGQTVDLTQESVAAGATGFHVQLRTAKDGTR